MNLLFRDHAIFTHFLQDPRGLLPTDAHFCPHTSPKTDETRAPSGGNRGLSKSSDVLGPLHLKPHLGVLGLIQFNETAELPVS
jgi:hypothetical protein